MLAHSYRLRLTERVRQLAFLTLLGALLNAIVPRLVAHEWAPASVQPATDRPTELPVVSPLVGVDGDQPDLPSRPISSGISGCEGMRGFVVHPV